MSFRDRFTISNIAWKPEERLDVYTLLQEEGIQNLEIAPGLFVPDADKPYAVSKEALQQKKEESEAYGLKLVSMQSLHFGTSRLHLFEDETARQLMLDYSKQAVDFASQLGIGNLVFGSPKNRIIPGEMSKEKALEIAMSFFKVLGGYAQSKKTCIGLEANASAYGCNFLTTTKSAVDFIAKLNNDAVKLNFDLGTFILENEKPSYLPEALEVANHVHISVPYLNAVYDYETAFHTDLRSAIESSGYKRYVSIEMRGTDQERSVGHIKKALSFLNRYYS